jgi:hypothetical protein
MLSLKTICIETIIKNDVDIKKHEIPLGIYEILAIEKIKNTCGDTATKIINKEPHERDITFEDYMDRLYPMHNCLGDKVYVINNIKSYLKAYHTGFYQQYFPKRPYIIHYLQQEEDYVRIYPQKGAVKRDDLI